MWREGQIFAVGGFREMGFFPHTDFLMVLSSTGRGIFDCLEAQKIARDLSDYYMENWNPATGIVSGFDAFEGQQTVCGGFEYPDTLPKETADQWTVAIKEAQRLNWKEVLATTKVLYLEHQNLDTSIEIGLFDEGVSRGYGFSDTGKSFVMGTSYGLTIWNRSL